MPCRSSCWCPRTIARKRRRTRLRTTAPPRRPEVTNPARQGPESSTGIAFNIRSLSRCVMPCRFTRSYSERCVRRRAFGKENEPPGDISNVKFPSARSTNLKSNFATGGDSSHALEYKEVFHREPGEDFSKPKESRPYCLGGDCPG